MRRIQSLLIGILVLLIAVASIVWRGTASASPAQQGRPGRQASPCIGKADKWVMPKTMLLGERTQITLTMWADCPEEAIPLHIVFVLDRSGSMAGQKLTDMKNAAREAIIALDMARNQHIKVGVVSFAHESTIDVRLTNSASQAISAIMRLQANGGTAIDLGIDDGRSVLMLGRRDPALQGKTITEVMVVLTDGGNNNGPAPVLAAAGRAKAQGILMIAVCVGTDCDSATMRQVASGPRYYFEARQSSQLAGVFRQIIRNIIDIQMRRLTITDVFPDNIKYVDDSAFPDYESWNGRTMTWQFSHVPKQGVSITYWIEPQEAGTWPTNVIAQGEFTDSTDKEGTVTFPVPEVLVLVPVTLSPPPPTPTPTVTPSPTNTPPPTPTPTPTPPDIYLPIAISQDCEDYFSDVVLLIDASSSMGTYYTRDGRLRLEAAKEAASEFVRLMQSNHHGSDQVAVVTFNRTAELVHPLSSDQDSLTRAIQGINWREYTYIHLGIDKAREELSSSRHIATNRKAIILLSDGANNPQPAAMAVAAAERAKATDITIYVIGLGMREWYDPETLAAIASGPDKLYHSGGDNLTQIYTKISEGLRCSDRFIPWP